jgi:integrase
MRTFRSTYVDRRGVTRRAVKWTVEFRDHREIARRLTLFSDKAATDEAGRKLQRLADVRRMGQPPGRELEGFLEALSDGARARLAQWGLLEPERAAVTKFLTDHMSDWKAALADRGNTENHVAQQHARALKVFEMCAFGSLSQINAGALQKALNTLRDGGLGPQTLNYHLGACKQFCRWAVRERRLAENPLVHMEPLNAKLDIRRERRALTHAECGALVEAVEHSGKRGGMDGPQRALLYRLALTTGLRANELRGLKVGDFDLKRAAVRVRASTSKNRRETWQPIPLHLCDPLKKRFDDRLPTSQAFSMASPTAITKAFIADLKAAKIERLDDTGRIMDFHGLRHTFITLLADSGVHPNVAKTLARHSTITLTMDRYSHVRLDDERKALESLPTLEPSVPQRATGTLDAAPTLQPQPDGTVLASCLASKHGKTANSVDNHDNQDVNAPSKSETDHRPQTRLESTESAPEAGSGADAGWRWRGDSNPRMTDLQSVA